MNVGIIPAAGRAARWHMPGPAWPKELLPVGNQTFLGRTVNVLANAGCEVIVVVTSQAKIQAHQYVLNNYRGRPIFYVVQHQDSDMWGAIQAGLAFPGDRYFFAMPDTYIPLDAFEEAPLDHEISLGVFRTTNPEWFGTIREGRIYNKVGPSEPVDPTKDYTAWGTLIWSKNVADIWRRQYFSNYTDALNTVMSIHGYGTWYLKFYRDVGDAERYQSLIHEMYGNSKGLSAP